MCRDCPRENVEGSQNTQKENCFTMEEDEFRNEMSVNAGMIFLFQINS